MFAVGWMNKWCCIYVACHFCCVKYYIGCPIKEVTKSISDFMWYLACLFVQILQLFNKCIHKFPQIQQNSNVVNYSFYVVVIVVKCTGAIYSFDQNKHKKLLTMSQHRVTEIMACCRQATSHYLNQCWPRFMSPYGATSVGHNELRLHVVDMHWGNHAIADCPSASGETPKNVGNFIASNKPNRIERSSKSRQNTTKPWIILDTLQHSPNG